MTDGEGDRAETALRSMLYDGEDLGDVIHVNDAAVAVTSHRVLVLDPDGEPRFRKAALPNVTEAGPDTDGDVGVALQALKFGTYAVVLFGVSLLVDFQGFVNDLLASADVPSGQGVGQVVSMIHSIVGLLGLVDDLLGIAGLGFALIALFFALRYARSRTRALTFEVSGDDPIQVPIERADIGAAREVGDAVERARSALREPESSRP